MQQKIIQGIKKAVECGLQDQEADEMIIYEPKYKLTKMNIFLVGRLRKVMWIDKYFESGSGSNMKRIVEYDGVLMPRWRAILKALWWTLNDMAKY